VRLREDYTSKLREKEDKSTDIKSCATTSSKEKRNLTHYRGSVQPYGRPTEELRTVRSRTACKASHIVNIVWFSICIFG
jgi:hypothetical protein